MDNGDVVAAVQRMQDYIEAHINEEITLNSLAKEAGYSLWHSARVFKEWTGKTPFDYIRSLRLSRAAIQLQDEGRRVVDVAFNFLFGSHEGFTRAFSRQFGVTPKFYCQNAPKIKLFMPTPVRDLYLTIEEGEKTMKNSTNTNTIFVQVVERPARRVILKRGVKATHYFEYCEEVGCDVWEILCGIKEALYEPIGMWLPENLRMPGTSVYVQGVEMPEDYNGVVPEGFELIDLKPCQMMVFQGPPYDDEGYETAIEDVWEVMKRYNPEIYGFRWADEDGPRFQLAPMGYRGYIEARPVRPVNGK
ncbi:MAG TPA: AraC family transcriptional regulator [Bacillota bacterium]|nr:AraC family transcriptional regulator [Bacillota bacterium]